MKRIIFYLPVFLFFQDHQVVQAYSDASITENSVVFPLWDNRINSSKKVESQQWSEEKSVYSFTDENGKVRSVSKGEIETGRKTNDQPWVIERKRWERRGPAQEDWERRGPVQKDILKRRPILPAVVIVTPEDLVSLGLEEDKSSSSFF